MQRRTLLPVGLLLPSHQASSRSRQVSSRRGCRQNRVHLPRARRSKEESAVKPDTKALEAAVGSTGTGTYHDLSCMLVPAVQTSVPGVCLFV